MSWLGYDARPAAVKTWLAYSLQRLGIDHIDIYRPARLDPQVPIEETVGAIAELVQAGYVRYIGLSEVGPETIRRAAAVHPICDLQIEYSLISRGIEAEILPVCRELGIAITAYGVLSRGLISGHWTPDRERHRHRFPQPGAALSGREPGAQPGARRCAASGRRRRRRERRAGGDRLGAVARGGHRAADRRANARPAHRGAGGARARPLATTTWPGSSRRCRATPQPVTAIRRRRWASSTASAADRPRRPGGGSGPDVCGHHEHRRDHDQVQDHAAHRQLAKRRVVLVAPGHAAAVGGGQVAVGDPCQAPLAGDHERAFDGSDHDRGADPPLDVEQLPLVQVRGQIDARQDDHQAAPG